jgi:hypothetical protein
VLHSVLMLSHSDSMRIFRAEIFKMFPVALGNAADYSGLPGFRGHG